MERYQHTFLLRQLLQFIASFCSPAGFLTGKRSIGRCIVANSLLLCCATAIMIPVTDAAYSVGAQEA